jgi:hypothetical protein
MKALTEETLPPPEWVAWQLGAPPIEAGQRRRYWCAVRSSPNGKITHRALDYLNRHAMPVSDQCEPSTNAEPVPDSDGEYFWTGWFEEACDQCETSWAYNGEVVAWMALPRLP